MNIEHDTVVAFTKSYGLFYLVGLAVAVLVYTFWPSNRRLFDHAARSVLDDEDTPCQ